MTPIPLAGWAFLLAGTAPMQIWAGLGNPGAQYALHRHNVGFMVADVIAGVHGFGPWQKKFRSLISEGRIGGHKILLLKPQTFMNDSGDAVQQALRFYKLDIEALTAFHDELDLAPMKVKVKVGGGTAGHNGLRSIDASLGPDFRRVRIGIGHPGHKDRVTPHVLGNYAKSEMDALSDLLGAIGAEAEWLADGDDARFMSEIARRIGED
jgi:peptidyl-tRNA hydrolase, PTH1 family